MTGYTLVVFKESETELDTLFSITERLEHISSETYTDIGEAYEKLTVEQSRGNKAILLSNSLVMDLAKNIVKENVNQVLFSK